MTHPLRRIWSSSSTTPSPTCSRRSAAALGDAIVDVLLKPGDDLWVRVRTDSWVATGEALKAIGFDYFCFLSVMDWLPSPFGKGEDDPTEPPPERETAIRPGVCGGDTRFQLLAGCPARRATGPDAQGRRPGRR